MSDKRFDEIIRKKLEALEADYASESWNALQAKMLLDPELSGVDDFFDASIKSKLSEVEMPYDPTSWEMLAHKMEVDNALNPDSSYDLDEVIQEKMEGFTIPLTDGSWQMLKDRMRKEAKMRTRLYIAKATEVLIIFLLLFTVYRLLPPNLTHKNTIKLSTSESNESSQTPETKAIEVLPKDIINTEHKNDLPVQTTPERAERSSPANNNQLQASVVPALGQDDETVHPSSTHHTTNANRTLANLILLPRHSHSNLLNRDSEKIIADDYNSAATITENSSIGIYSESPSNDQIAQAEFIDPSTTTGIEYTSELSIKDDLIVIPPSPKKTKVWLNGFISADAMLINTPYDPVFEVPAFSKAAAGFSGGVSVSVQRGSVEVDAGLAYASKGYQPQIIRELNGSLATNFVERSLTEIIFDMAQANFNIKNHFFVSNKLQLYLMAGTSYNLITYSEYNFEEKSRNGQPFPLIAPIQTKLLDQKEFTDGALEGGGLFDNSFLTLNFGFGLQHKINDKTSLFFQPNYQRHILDGGIGPNNDRIHNLSLQIGTKIRLN